MKRSEMIDKIDDAFWEDGRVPVTSKLPTAIMKKIEEAGMLPPPIKPQIILEKYPEHFEDDGYHGIVCKYSHREYRTKLPEYLHKYVKVVNCGEYFMVEVRTDLSEWEPE